MKTLLTIAVIWVLYSMYRIVRYKYYDDVVIFSGMFGFVALAIYIIHLIITYLP